MRSLILTLLAAGAIALNVSVSEAAPLIPIAKTEAATALTVYVYRYARRATVVGPRGGVYHGRTVVRRGPYGGGYVAHRGVYGRRW